MYGIGTICRAHNSNSFVEVLGTPLIARNRVTTRGVAVTGHHQGKRAETVVIFSESAFRRLYRPATVADFAVPQLRPEALAAQISEDAR